MGKHKKKDKKQKKRSKKAEKKEQSTELDPVQKLLVNQMIDTLAKNEAYSK